MSGGPVRDTARMIAEMDPERAPGSFVFAVSDAPALAAHALAVIREAEGTTLILPVGLASEAGLTDGPAMACITLSVHSSLEGVGLTAAVSGALARAGIPANIVAGYHHDHVFVPETRASEALAVLQAAAQR